MRTVVYMVIVFVCVVLYAPIQNLAVTCTATSAACRSGEQSYYAPSGSAVCATGGFYCTEAKTQTNMDNSTAPALTPKVTTPKITTAPSISTQSSALAFGSRGQAVTTLQDQLILLGYLASDSATGYFGKLTQAALQQFQLDNNLEPVGYVGPKTKKALATTTPNSTASSKSPITPLPSFAQPSDTPSLIASLLAQVKALQDKLAVLKSVSTAINTDVASDDSGGGGITNIATSTTTSTSGTQTTGASTYVWNSGPWSSCSNSTQSRTVTCISSANQSVADSLCTIAKPTTAQSCVSSSCIFNTQSVSHGSSVTAYQSASVAYGKQCVSELRTCTNGTLSGSYASASCTVLQSEGSSSSVLKTLKVPIFKAFNWDGMPSVEQFKGMGIETIYDLGANLQRNGPIDVAAARELTRQASLESSSPVMVIDLEDPNYPFDIRTSPKTSVDQTIQYVLSIIATVKETNPNAKVGVYGFVPLNDYWVPNYYVAANTLAPTNSWWAGTLPQAARDYVAWTEANAYLKPIADKVDYLFPSLYTYYDEYKGPDGMGWELFANMQIYEARKYGKPVYVYVWPNFHPGGQHNDTSYLPQDYWAKQINYVRYYADGIVIWGWGGFLNDKWNEQAPWWIELKKLIKTLE